MKKLLLGACIAAACWMSDAGAMEGKDIDGKNISIGSCSSGKFLMVNRWELGNPSGECEYLHTNYKDTEKQFEQEKSKANFTEEMKNLLYTLPESVGELDSLKVLDIDGDYRRYGDDSRDDCKIRLRALPDSIGNLVNLRVLNIYGNQLRSIPDSIGNLKNLEELDLRGNKLEALPDSIGNLRSLVKLNLEKNKLTALPDSIVNLRNLKKLELDQNDCLYTEKESVKMKFREKPEEFIKPKEIPEKIYDFLENLEDLRLPKFISIRLFSLEKSSDFRESHKWNVKLHKREYVSTGFSHYDYQTRQRVLDNKWVDIKSYGIPVDISIATDMRSLDARGVSVKKIPPSFSKLTKLEDLDLRDNPDLTELPAFLWKMPRLKELWIDVKDDKDDSLMNSVPAERVILNKRRVLNWVSDKGDLDKKFSKLIKLLHARKKGLSNRGLMELFGVKNLIRLKPLS